MDSESLGTIKIKSSFSLKDEKSDVLETPQIRNFRHENENVFSCSFNQENLKNSGSQVELSRLNSITLAENAESPLAHDISASILDPIEIQQASAIVSFTNTSIDPSRSAPKKKFLERTISQTDAEQQKQEPMQEFNFPRDLTDKNLRRSISIKQAEIEDTSSKPNKTLQLPLSVSVQSVNENVNNLKKPMNKPQNEYNNNKKTTIETLLNYQQPSAKINSLITIQQKESLTKTTNHINNIEEDGQSDAKKFKKNSKEDLVTSIMPDADKKPKSKRSIMMNSDLRKQQIRNSNREAARRCRERRSNYIKQLENKITVLETKQKALLTDNGSLLKQVHDLKKIIECNLTSSFNANSHNFNGQSNTNFSALFSSQQIKSVPVLLTLEIPNGNGMNPSSVDSNNNNNNVNNTNITNGNVNTNMRQITNVINGNSSLMNSPILKHVTEQDILKQVADAIQYNNIRHKSPLSAQSIESQSHLNNNGNHHHHNHNHHQSTKINK